MFCMFISFNSRKSFLVTILTIITFIFISTEINRLSGLSPFMGSTDIETMTNVTIGKYDFDDEAFSKVSKDALDFISKLLEKDLR